MALAKGILSFRKKERPIHVANQDGGQFEPYTDAINAVIERNYMRMMFDEPGRVEFVTEPLVRYLDDR